MDYLGNSCFLKVLKRSLTRYIQIRFSGQCEKIEMKQLVVTLLQQSPTPRNKTPCKESNNGNQPTTKLQRRRLIDDFQDIIPRLPNRLLHDKLWRKLWSINHVSTILHEQFKQLSTPSRYHCRTNRIKQHWRCTCHGLAQIPENDLGDIVTLLCEFALDLLVVGFEGRGGCLVELHVAENEDGFDHVFLGEMIFFRFLEEKIKDSLEIGVHLPVES
jgi:hypothetical protein